MLLAQSLGARVGARLNPGGTREAHGPLGSTTGGEVELGLASPRSVSAMLHTEIKLNLGQCLPHFREPYKP